MLNGSHIGKRNSTVACMDNDVYISTFEKDDRILAAVSCFSGAEEKCNIVSAEEEYAHLLKYLIIKGTAVKDDKMIFSPDISMAYLFVIFEDTTAYKK